MKRASKLIALAFVSTMITVSSCKKEESLLGPDAVTESPDISEKGLNPDEAAITDETARHIRTAYIYTETNATSQNEIVCYKQHADGSLTLESTTASGGTGLGAFNGGGLGSQGALALTRNHQLLFAVNAGSNSVSSFTVDGNGGLTLAYTVSSGGVAPVSLCIKNHILYVVNSTSSNIAGFTVGAGGTMTPIPGSNLPLSAAVTAPAQISFSPNGNFLYVTEKATNVISSYTVDNNGLATFDQALPSTGVTPFGFCYGRDNYMIVSNANAPNMMPVPNGSSCTAYGGANQGNLSPENGAVGTGQTAACWVATTEHGRFAYVTNTGSDNISSYYVSPWGNIYLIHSNAVSTGDGPTDIVVAPNNYYVYALNFAAGTIGGYRRAFLGDLAAVGTTPGLPQFAAGLVAW